MKRCKAQLIPFPSKAEPVADAPPLQGVADGLEKLLTAQARTDAALLKLLRLTAPACQRSDDP